MRRPAWVILAMALMIGIGVAPAADNEYNATATGQNASTWDPLGSVIVRPNSSTATDISVTVTAGSGISMAGGLGVSASAELPAINDQNVQLVFDGATNQVGIAFAGNAVISGTTTKGASLVVNSSVNDTYIAIAGITTLGTNAGLEVTGSEAQFYAAGGLTVDSTDRSLLTGNNNIWLHDSGVLNVGGSGLTITNGAMLVEDSAAVLTNSFVLGGSGTTTSNTVTIRDGGLFIVMETTPANTPVALIQSGTFTIAADAGAVDFHGGVTIDSSAAVMNVSHSVLLGTGKTIEITNGGALNILDNATIADSAGGGGVANTSGTLTVAAGKTLTSGFLTSSGTTSIQGSVVAPTVAVSGGQTTITGSVTAHTSGNTGSFQVGGGTVTLNGTGTVTADTFQVASGTVNLNNTSEVTATSFQVASGAVSLNNTSKVTTTSFSASGGAVSIASGAKVDAESFAVTGSAVANISGTVDHAPGLKFVASGGTVNLNTGSQLAATGGFTEFSVGGSAVVNAASAITIGSGTALAFTGGTINLNTGGSFSVAAMASPSLSLGGTLVFAGGTAAFNNDVSFAAGGLRSATSAAVLDMNGHTLAIGGGAMLDASAANLAIANSNGLTITGAYKAGYVGGNYTMARVASPTGGALTIGGSATITMTAPLEGQAQSAVSAGGELLILDTQFTNGSTITLEWDNGFYSYQYTTRQDGSGNWGLYVSGFTELSEDAKYWRLINAWNPNPNVNGYAQNLINRSFASAVSGARRLQVSSYDSLTPDGKFNADALAAISNPAASGADYDALMLYNGSGLALVNRAIIDSHRKIIRSMEERTDLVNQQLLAAGETIGSGSALASDILNCAANRIWAGGYFAEDKAKWDEGFAGYSYKPRGLIVGYDRLFGNLYLGGAFAYNGGDFKDYAALSNNSTIDTYAFNVYGGYRSANGLFVSGALGASWSENAIHDRRVLNGASGWNHADYHSNNWLAALNAGYDWHIGETLTLTPSAGLRYIASKGKGHSQFFIADSGGGANTLNPGNTQGHSTSLPLKVTGYYGIRYNDDSFLALSGSAGYTYEFGDGTTEGQIAYGGLSGINLVDMVSRRVGKHALNLGLGAKYYYRQYEFGLGYEYETRSKYSSHTGALTAGVTF